MNHSDGPRLLVGCCLKTTNQPTTTIHQTSIVKIPQSSSNKYPQHPASSIQPTPKIRNSCSFHSRAASASKSRGACSPTPGKALKKSPKADAFNPIIQSVWRTPERTRSIRHHYWSESGHANFSINLLKGAVRRKYLSGRLLFTPVTSDFQVVW